MSIDSSNEGDNSQITSNETSDTNTTIKTKSQSSNDVYKRCVQRRLQRYDTYGDDVDDGDEDGEDDVCTNSKNENKRTSHNNNVKNKSERSLLQAWERTGAMEEVVGSQSLLTQELELKRYASIGSILGSINTNNGKGIEEVVGSQSLLMQELVEMKAGPGSDVVGGDDGNDVFIEEKEEEEEEVAGENIRLSQDELGLTRFNSIDTMELKCFDSIGTQDLKRFDSIGSMGLKRFDSMGLKRLNSIGTMITGKIIGKTPGVSIDADDGSEDECNDSEIRLGQTNQLRLENKAKEGLSVGIPVVCKKQDSDTGDEHSFDDDSQDTLVGDNIVMKGDDDADSHVDDDNGDCNDDKSMTDDILNNRILASQLEEGTEDDEDQDYNSSSHQQHQPLSLSQLSQISIPLTQSQASITMSGYDMIIGAAQELAKRDGEDVPFHSHDGTTMAAVEGSQECVDLGCNSSNGDGQLNTDENVDSGDDDDDDWATLTYPLLLKKEENSTGVKTSTMTSIHTPNQPTLTLNNGNGNGNGNGKEGGSIMISNVQKEENGVLRNGQENNNNEDQSKGEHATLQEINHKGVIKKVTDEEIATIWNREDGSIIPPPKINPPSSIKQEQHVDALRVGAISKSKPICGCGSVSGIVAPVKYPQAMQQSNKSRPKMIPTDSVSLTIASPSPSPSPSPPHVTPTPPPPTAIPPKTKSESATPTIKNSIDTKKRPAPTSPLPPLPPAHRLVRKTKTEREAEKAETNNIAKRAAELVSQFRVDRSVEKQLLLSMALTRENPRSAPNLYPGHGTSIYNGFYWGQYPPLEKVLRSHMEEYYELSITKCQSRAQQAFNNKLVALVKGEAEQYGWIFHKPDFDEKRIRDRIRCFFKTHIQNAKKRLKTMVRNPTKKANAKALVAHMDLINKHDKPKELEELLSSPICSNRGISDDGVSNFIVKDDDSRPYGHSDMSGVTNCSNNNLVTCEERSLLTENEDCTKSILREKDPDARDAAQVLALGFGR